MDSPFYPTELRRRNFYCACAENPEVDRNKKKMDETGQQATFEEDPAAAFLAREQDELADIAEDTLGFTPGASEVSFAWKKDGSRLS